MTKWDDIKHFDPSEFDCPGVPGSGRKNMNVDFVSKLDSIRSTIGKALKINSGWRTYEHNLSVGGVPQSAHTFGRAADITCRDSRKRFSIVRAAIADAEVKCPVCKHVVTPGTGISRIGIAKGFVHLDDDPNKDQEVIWLY